MYPAKLYSLTNKQENLFQNDKLHFSRIALKFSNVLNGMSKDIKCHILEMLSTLNGVYTGLVRDRNESCFIQFMLSILLILFSMYTV